MSSILYQNEWELKTTKNEGSCFICSKFTTGCLVFKSAPIDWFFVCLSHLEDVGFAKLIPIPTPNNSTELNQSKEIKPKEQEKEQEKDKDKEKEGKEGESKPNEPTTPIEPPKPQPKYYQLHRNILYLRENQLKLKKQNEKLKATQSKLPKIPNHELK